jgi:chromodomain-helicase-DNA-binding protein 7
VFEWWIPGKHDQDLLLGAARHGLARMEYYILNDVELSFKDVLKRSLAQENLVDKEEMELWEAARKERKQQQENDHSPDGEDEKMDTSEEGKRGGKGKKKGKEGKRKKGEAVDKDHEESGENGELDNSAY